jgi:hypothetical protein
MSRGDRVLCREDSGECHSDGWEMEYGRDTDCYSVRGDGTELDDETVNCVREPDAQFDSAVCTESSPPLLLAVHLANFIYSSKPPISAILCRPMSPQ